MLRVQIMCLHGKDEKVGFKLAIRLGFISNVAIAKYRDIERTIVIMRRNV